MVERRALGRTGMLVCPLGLSSAGISGEDLQYGIEQGINFVFHSTDLHAFAYQRSLSTLKKYCKRGSKLRNSIVLAVCTYVNSVNKLDAVLVDQMYTLGVDHVDIFLWGWVSEDQHPDNLIAAATRLKTAPSRGLVEQISGLAREASDRVRSAGYARFVGLSTHDRHLASRLYRSSNADVIMLRYNIAHRGVEADIFRETSNSRPGIVAFNATHNNMGSFAGRSLPQISQRVTYEEL